MTSLLHPHLYPAPSLQDCEDLVSRVRAFYKTVDSRGLISFNYRAATYSDFTHPYAREMRGITYDNHGNMLARPWFKFFNYGENPFSDKVAVESFGKNMLVFEKVDGSLVYPVMINGEVVMKTKASSDTPMAKIAQGMITDDIMSNIIRQLDMGYTPMFELIGPSNPNILVYDSDRLVYLGKRSIQTGIQYPSSRFDGFVDIPVQYYGSDIKTLLDECEYSDDHIEGYVAMFSTGEMVKFKTKWYHAIHRIAADAHDETAIARLVITDNLDDMISALPDQYHAGVLEIAVKISDVYNRDLKAAEDFYQSNQMLTRKQFAIKCIDSCLPKHISGVAMDMRNSCFDIAKYNDRFISSKRWKQ